MKVKATPGDFVVREESGVALSPHPGPFAYFRLAKTSWDTFDLIDLISRKLRVSNRDIRVGGFKDRHGDTEQLVSIRGLHGRPGPLQEANFRLTFEGWSDEPISAKSIRGNRFTITLRDLTEGEASWISANAPEAARDGVPNYYDEQRFGSARHGKGFLGKELFLGRREQALRLYFTPSNHDEQRIRKLKRCVTENWGHWERCSELGIGEYGRILAYLGQNPRAYHEALRKIDRRFLVFALNAYQSFLFNEILARWLRGWSAQAKAQLSPVRYRHGTYEFFRGLDAGAAAELHRTALPVPGHDTRVSDPRIRSILEAVLEAEGIELADLRVRQMSGIRVGGVERAAVVIPEGLRVSERSDDERYPGRLRMTLEFFLPRGSYATILLKRLILAPAR